jgi:lysophospholipase L1-like esterase
MKRLLALAVALAALAVASPAHAGARRYYLALGDSHAFGFQFPKYAPGVTATAFHTGYADVIAAARPALVLVNYGCPGDSTVTFTTGPCPYKAAGQQLHDDYARTQLAAALEFLLAHRGRTELVTITLWGNDIKAFLRRCEGELACIRAETPAEIASFSARLTAIVGALRLAAGPRTAIVLTGPYDSNLQPLAEQTHPLFRALDDAMRLVAERVGARYVALLETFGSDAALCTLTLLCSDGDAHPSDVGYTAIAERIMEAIQ